MACYTGPHSSAKCSKWFTAIVLNISFCLLLIMVFASNCELSKLSEYNRKFCEHIYHFQEEPNDFRKSQGHNWIKDSLFMMIIKETAQKQILHHVIKVAGYVRVLNMLLGQVLLFKLDNYFSVLSS